MTTILVVDPDEASRATLAEELAREGTYTIEQAPVLPETPRAVELIVLGVSARTRIPKTRCPILAITHDAHLNPHLTSPAVFDTLIKPFRLTTLLSRVRTALAEHGGAMTLGPYRFVPADKMLVLGEETIVLTEKETAILQFLLTRPQGASRDTLLREVWGYREGLTTHTLETHIYRLRKKLNHDANVLQTHKGLYRLFLEAQDS